MSLKSYTALKDLGLSDAIIEIASVRVVEEGYGIYSFFRSCTSMSTGAKKLTSHRCVVTCTRQVCDSQLFAS